MIATTIPAVFATADTTSRTSPGRPKANGRSAVIPLPPSKRQLFTGNVWAENFLLVRFAIFSYMAIRHAEVIVPDPTEHLINMVRRTADARGARLVVGLQRHEPRLEAYLRTQGIPFTSFDEAKGYPTAGWHWTPEGNAVVAARYLALFTELGIASSLAPPASDLAESIVSAACSTRSRRRLRARACRSRQPPTSAKRSIRCAPPCVP